ncbi:hypothetical protein [Paraburkholderia phenoliruptrix]|uniref:Uncharacterized protein n=1 Tax=Paraburkholderia phenoliruptrix TaxID=252970 RepID=A0A6J5KDH2_9BURK|nr:hypothetical protein [Paraburkholderia phenoliruptrix]CAB4051691.1 hypothetical protein LMG9964_05370 [Paraburkholderia phenoliruptrix]
MNLHTLKQLEDIKAEHAPIIEQLQKRTAQTVESALHLAGEEFRLHFEGAGFSVTGQYPGQLGATYQTLQFRLVFDEKPRLDSFAVLTVTKDGQKQPDHSFTLTNKAYNGPRVHVTVGTPDPVQTARKSLEESRALLASTMELEYRIDDVAVPGKTAAQVAKGFATFGDALREYYK